MEQICLFCGSNLGAKPVYQQVARELGKVLAESHIGLIYGGSNVGLMKAAAEQVLECGGQVTGVITHFLAGKHLTQQNITKLIMVDTMLERKTQMMEMADGFIALPGGFGTFDELFEVLIGAQLGFHNKPIAVINTDGFYDFLKLQVDRMVQERMLLRQQANMILFVDTPQQALIAMKEYTAPIIEKWIENIRVENGHTL